MAGLSHAVDREGWLEARGRLEDGTRSFLSIWADGGTIRCALLDAEVQAVEVLALDCPDGTFPSLGAVHLPAQRLERVVRELSGLVPEGHPDGRRWMDHGRWELRRPLSRVPTPHEGTPDAYPFLPVEGDSLHEIPVGPVHAGIIEPGHFRFTAQGETVVRLEARLGWVHKGIERSLIGADLQRADRIVGRVTGDATVAWQWAFAMAVERICGVSAPPRAQVLRAVMAELERIANHLGDVGAVCNDAAFAILHTHTGILREEVLRTCGELFGHRLMMGRIEPFGVDADLDDSGRTLLHSLITALRPRVAELEALYDTTPSLQDRTQTTGIIRPEAAKLWAAGGFVGRASGRDFDTRRDLAYGVYATHRPRVPTLEAGDVDARVRLRLAEILASLDLLESLIAELPGGPLRTPTTIRDGEGLGIVEAFRGDVLVWLRLQDGVVARCHPRDPSWFHWPLLEAAIEGNIVADFPLCNKSVNAAYSGVDL